MFDWLVKPVYADVKIIDVFGPIKNAVSFTTLGGLVSVIIPNILTLAGIVSFIGIIYFGIQYISHAGAGEGEKIAKDQQAFTGALIGLMIIFGAYFILKIVSTLIGYDFLNPTI